MAPSRLAQVFLQFRTIRTLSTYRMLHSIVLATGVVALTLLSVPEVRQHNDAWLLLLLLWSCFAFFTAEWLVRIWTAGGRAARRHYLASTHGLIDALAVLPIALALALGMPSETAWLLGALWLLKLAPMSPGLQLLGRVLATEAKPLASVVVIFLVVLFLAAVSIHILERDAQPDKFGSLPGALWWGVATLTTTGYGDYVPQSQLGRFIAGLIMVCGVGVFGLLTGILATGFVAEGRRRDFIQNWNLVARVPFLQALDPKGIIEVTRMLRRLDVPERTVVIRRGRAGDCMYFIAAGEVEVELDPRPVRLGSGAFFGEMALLGDGVRMATVATTVPTTLLVLDLSDFHAVTAHHPDLAKAVETEAARRRAELRGAHDDAKITPLSVDSRAG